MKGIIEVDGSKQKLNLLILNSGKVLKSITITCTNLNNVEFKLFDAFRMNEMGNEQIFEITLK